MLEHPEITKALRTGYPHGEPKWPICPVCGKECETIYMDRDGEIFACDECLQTENAWECDKCFEEDET